MKQLILGPQFEQVPVTRIEAELDRLWREASDRALATGEAVVSRNTVLSLVAYAQTVESAQLALSAISDLTAEHPARAIVLLSDPDSPDAGISAHIAVHHQTSGPDAGSSEQIVIQAEGDAARHVPGFVLPLLITGLPAFLWWTGDPPWGTALVETMVDGSDRLIIDSCDSPDSDITLTAAAELVRRKHTRCALSDFNWTRQSPWRELTAQFFDSPTFQPYLQGVDRLTVEYAAGDEEEPTNSAQAHLFVGWLASRLNWTLPQTHRRSFGPARQYTLHDVNGRSIAVELNARFGMMTTSWRTIAQPLQVGGDGYVPTHDGGIPRSMFTVSRNPLAIGHGALVSVRLHAVAGGRPGTFIIARDQDLQHATTLTQVDSGAQPSHTVHLASLGEAALLHGQLELMGHDAVFEAALATGARLTGADFRRSTV
jgi:glucose-6-phosphate dehydrogenase assembly protein OpcA